VLVRDVMTPRPITCEPGSTLQEVLDQMVRQEIREVPIVENGHVVGIVTDRDVKMMLGPGARSLSEPELDEDVLGRDVSWAMTAEVETITPTTTLSVAADILVDFRVGALPVVDGLGRLVGILSVTDLLRVAARVFAEQEA
jgi:CBS domain-containing protein